MPCRPRKSLTLPSCDLMVSLSAVACCAMVAPPRKIAPESSPASTRQTMVSRSACDRSITRPNRVVTALSATPSRIPAKIRNSVAEKAHVNTSSAANSAMPMPPTAIPHAISRRAETRSSAATFTLIPSHAGLPRYSFGKRAVDQGEKAGRISRRHFCRESEEQTGSKRACAVAARASCRAEACGKRVEQVDPATAGRHDPAGIYGGIGLSAMSRPVVGVIGNAYRVENRFATQMVGERNLRAVAEGAGALPLMFAGAPDITDIGALLDVVDGVVLTGARANVHPTRFGIETDPKHEPYDIARDDLALSLTEACVARGVPLFGICRGLQEMNVAFGGSLHPEIREIPGRMNHRMPRLENGETPPDPTVVFADRHEVTLVPGGAFALLLGCETIRVNSLHGQGILNPGQRVVVEGIAEDGTIEAIRIADAPGFALGVQWHAEYDPQCNPINRALFQAFGEALLQRQRAA